MFVCSGGFVLHITVVDLTLIWKKSAYEILIIIHVPNSTNVRFALSVLSDITPL